MTNTQLFFAIGVPVLVMILGFVQQGRGTRDGLSVLEAKLTGKLDSVDARLTGRMDSVDVRLDALTRGQEQIHADLKEFNRVTHELDKRVDRLEQA